GVLVVMVPPSVLKGHYNPRKTHAKRRKPLRVCAASDDSLIHRQSWRSKQEQAMLAVFAGTGSVGDVHRHQVDTRCLCRYAGLDADRRGYTGSARVVDCG